MAKKPKREFVPTMISAKFALVLVEHLTHEFGMPSRDWVAPLDTDGTTIIELPDSVIDAYRSSELPAYRSDNLGSISEWRNEATVKVVSDMRACVPQGSRLLSWAFCYEVKENNAIHIGYSVDSVPGVSNGIEERVRELEAQVDLIHKALLRLDGLNRPEPDLGPGDEIQFRDQNGTLVRLPNGPDAARRLKDRAQNAEPRDETVSERCRRTHEQNCYRCEDFRCGDNLNRRSDDV